MTLLFVAGVMNLLWVAVIALFVMAEKMLPKGEFIARISGVALILAGVAMAAHLF
jgi:predicted metal-binding membrane protein